MIIARSTVVKRVVAVVEADWGRFGMKHRPPVVVLTRFEQHQGDNEKDKQPPFLPRKKASSLAKKRAKLAFVVQWRRRDLNPRPAMYPRWHLHV